MAIKLPLLSAHEVSSGMASSAAILLILGTIGLVVLGLTFAVALATLRRKPRPQSGRRAGISVLKPLKGVEARLEENLIAVLTQDHPEFEVLFAAEDPLDPALTVARSVCARFPHVRTAVLVGQVREGLNPKVRLLRELEKSAQYPFLLISDSNVCPGPSYLRELQDRQTESGAALVHCLLGSTTPEGLADDLERLQLATWVVPTVSLTSLCRRPVVIGKSMLLAREALNRVGGFEAVRDVLAEDHILGELLTKGGETIALSPYLLPVSSVGRGFRGFWNRYVRWGQMQKTIAPIAFVMTLFVQPMPYLALAAWRGSSLQAGLAFGLIGLKASLDFYLLIRVGGRITPRILVAWLVKDILFVATWFASLLSRTVSWRGQRMLVGSGSRLSPLATSR
jgi:ceramide glucosyltransferase